MARMATDKSVDDQPDAVTLSVDLCWRLLMTAEHMNEQGLKGFGFLVGNPSDPRIPYAAQEAIFFDPTRNRRNDPQYRSAFCAQGDYFRTYDDAGFVADSRDVLAVWRSVERRGLEIVAPFHVHRRQPANFSVIDYRLHNPTFAWHLILSVRDPARPVLRAFRVSKDAAEFGISEHDARQNSESDYLGPEVTPLPVVAEGD